MTLPVSWILFASIALLLLSVYLFVLERRWLARFRRGFLITLMLALSGIGVGASLLVGIWGYDSAERVLSGQTVQTLGNIGRIIEGEIGVALDQAVVQMEGLAGTVAGNLAADSGPKSLPSFEELEHINARFLQLDLIDSKGNTRLSIGRQRKTEPVNRVASAFGFEGQRFTSDPY